MLPRSANDDDVHWKISVKMMRVVLFLFILLVICICGGVAQDLIEFPISYTTKRHELGLTDRTRSFTVSNINFVGEGPKDDNFSNWKKAEGLMSPRKASQTCRKAAQQIIAGNIQNGGTIDISVTIGSGDDAKYHCHHEGGSDHFDLYPNT